ncbi:MAG: asparagine--tRNA ligase [Nanoarchaeota archaeon]|nr:asparagine--tRNA ligase [Nanoarchaeota archaeon]MBU1030392.1 asparagine--tRNA ligase [Nanoarchaeota archaeon]MBU1849567.1 asparagine--tRNA ligase [Nanoarchaeota archaeon]
MTFISIKEAMNKGESEVSIRGWVYRERGSNKIKFIVLRDSSDIIQCVIKKDAFSDEKWNSAVGIQIETSMELHGTIKKDDRAPTGYEISVNEFNIIGESDTYPITKDQSPEFLLDKRHLWIRSRRLSTIMKIRSRYVQARDEFFRKEGFYRFDAPILQPNQCEGGSTLFEVKYYKDKTYLSQSWQLYAEAGVFALEKIYNMGPTFRAEKSKTSRHLSEFWMAEMEAAWFDLEKVTAFAKKELKYCIKKVAEDCSEELKILERDSKELLEMVEKDWPTIKYRKALKILKEKSGMNVEFGKDLRTIEEEKLMTHFKTPIIVTHYPKEAMAFYKPKDPEIPDEALCFDMLAPEGYGEIIGGSQRSTNIKEMEEELEKQGENIKNYDWYFDLRRYGSVPHAGYGVGVERVIAWICKIDNIKDAIPFPRTMLRKEP